MDKLYEDLKKMELTRHSIEERIQKNNAQLHLTSSPQGEQIRKDFVKKSLSDEEIHRTQNPFCRREKETNLPAEQTDETHKEETHNNDESHI